MKDDTILVTGAAGFIGFHVAQRLLSSGREVVGLDSVNDYYDPALKRARVDILKCKSNFTFVQSDLADRAATKSVFAQHRFPAVIHLAAQAGVRYSLEKPAAAYTDANIEGFPECARGMPPSRLRASALCVLIVGLWRQYKAAVFGTG